MYLSIHDILLVPCYANTNASCAFPLRFPLLFDPSQFQSQFLMYRAALYTLFIRSSGERICPCMQVQALFQNPVHTRRIEFHNCYFRTFTNPSTTSFSFLESSLVAPCLIYGPTVSVHWISTHKPSINETRPT